MLGNTYKAYQQQSIMTMTPSDMLTALYDGLLKELNFGKITLEKKDYAGANTHLQKAQKILNHLRTTLDFKYEISDSLAALYDYFVHVTVQANIQKQPDELDAVIEMVTDLRDTYIQAGKQVQGK